MTAYMFIRDNVIAVLYVDELIVLRPLFINMEKLPGMDTKNHIQNNE